MRQNAPEPRPGRAGLARGTRTRARAALAAIARLGAALCAAWILAGALAAPAAAHAPASASAAENSPLGLGRSPAPARALAELPQAPESPLESAFAYAQTALDNAYATRGVEAAGPRLLSAIPARVTNAANHVFGPNSLAKHKLEGVLGAFKGDATAAFYSLENAAQALANQGAIKGVFQTTVQVAGSNVTVRGAVIDGVARVSTAFIP